MMAESLILEVQRSLTALTTREAEVISLYFGLNGTQAMTLEEIAHKFDLTRERVRQIKEKATRRRSKAYSEKQNVEILFRLKIAK